MANVIKHKRGTSDPSPSDLEVGEIGIRTDVGKLFTKTDGGSVAEIAGGGSDIIINTLSSSSATGGGSATFNGSAYRFTLSQPPSVSAQQLLVSIAGVIQKPVAGSGQPSEGFSISGNDIILAQAPATGTDFFILTFKSLGVSEPADNTVTTAKIADDAVTTAKIADTQITAAKIASNAVYDSAIQSNAVSTAKIQDGAITNAKVNASAAIAGTKISPDFGSQAVTTTGNGNFANVILSDADPTIVFTDSNNNPDFQIIVDSGIFKVRDGTNAVDRFKVNSDGHIDVTGNLDVGSGVDVTGDITATGNLEITSANPKIYLTDTDNNSDYIVQNNNGAFRVYDNTNSSQRFIIGADGKAYFTQELNAQGGVTVTGDIEPATNGNGNIGNNGTGSPKKFSQAFFDVGVSISDSTTGLRLGTSFDTRFYHNGSGTNLDHSGTGGFLFRSNNGIMLTGSTSGGKVMANFTPDGSADLYYAHSKKFETQNLGVTVTGGVYPAATNTYQLGGSSLRWNELNIKSVIDVSDNGKIRMGDSDDFEIYHESGFNQIKTTNSSPIQLRTASELMIKAIPDAEVQIYHDGNEKIRTKSNGCLITGTLDINGGTENGAGDASLYVHANSNNDWGVVVDALSDGKSNYGLKIVGESGTTHAFSIVQGSSHTQKFLIDADGDTVTSGNVTAANFIGNGSQLTNLPASATNSPAFSAYRSNNYSPSNGSEVVIDFDQERIDTDGCYNFNNGRFTPTTAGNYQINLNFFWSGTSSNKIKQAHGYIRKNGSENIGQFWHDANDSYKENRQGVSVSTIVAMNGSTDYIEAIGYCLVDSGSPRFNAQGATFSGFKLA